MTVSPESVLSALRDIEGVLGSFVVDADGRILARDLPAMFDPGALTKASLHLSRLRAALESAGAGFESCVARFGPHLLVLRSLQSNTLCVLCPQGTNLPAVQMSSTLIARRLTGRTPVAYASASPLAQQSANFDPPAVAGLPDSAPSRRFRGRSL